jgi:hypothetical protein
MFIGTGTGMALLMEMVKCGMISTMGRAIILDDRMLSRYGRLETQFLKVSDLCRVRCGTYRTLLGYQGLLTVFRTMTMIHSENLLLQDIYVNSTSSTKSSTVNTDGADTIYANNITFKNWSITNGDDSISPKANSTNIHISNCTFYRGVGFALGSISQYNGVFERIENFTAEDVVFHNTLHAAYIKTWTGQQVGYPPNGGGGGTAVRNLLQFQITTNIQQT